MDLYYELLEVFYMSVLNKLQNQEQKTLTKVNFEKDSRRHLPQSASNRCLSENTGQFGFPIKVGFFTIWIHKLNNLISSVYVNLYLISVAYSIYLD